MQQTYKYNEQFLAKSNKLLKEGWVDFSASKEKSGEGLTSPPFQISCLPPPIILESQKELFWLMWVLKKSKHSYTKEEKIPLTPFIRVSEQKNS